ncbi:MAG: ATP-binding protein [Candidatus Thiodiazotropha sp.]
MDAAAGFVGRHAELMTALEATRKGNNLLVTGRAGIGKSAFLHRLRELLAEEGGLPPTVWVPYGTTKGALLEMARQLHEAAGLSIPATLLPPRNLARAKRNGTLPWSELVRTMRRLPVTESADLIADTLAKQRFLVVLESLEVPPSQAELFARVLERAQVIAAMDDKNRRSRIDRLLWRFPVRIELKPLPMDDCTAIVEQSLSETPIRFADENTRERFVRHVARDSGGVPAAIEGMLETARKEREITPAMARGFAHEAGVRYVDMTPLVILLIVIAMAARYVSRGLGDVEMLVLSGVATALFMGLRFVFWQMRRS